MPPVLRAVLLAAALATLATMPTAATPPRPHNVILFVADGMRPAMVGEATAPAMARLGRNGVRFANTHALFPTFTTPNASGMATGHHLGDTGNYGNTVYSGYPLPSAGGSVTPFIENDEVLGDIDDHFAGNYLDEETVLAAARAAGYSTAAIGKLGPVAIQDVTERSGQHTIILDDSTGRPGGIPLAPAVAERLRAAGLPLQAPDRGANGKAGNSLTPGTTTANVEQQRYFLRAATEAILPAFKAAGKPFVLVYWSRDPDGSQHNQGDSLGALVPGINGPTSRAAIRNADDNLAGLVTAIRDLGLAGDTDIVLTADHGFSTIAKQSGSSAAAQGHYGDVTAGQLPPGFLAIDLAAALGMKLADPDRANAAVDFAQGQHPAKSNGLLGPDPAKPEVVVAANGGSDLVYLPQANARELAPKVVAALVAQDYVSGLFVDDSLGAIPGTLPLSTIGLKGSAITPVPAIVVNFTSFGTGCSEAKLCAAEIADTGLQQGQGMHGNFSRADTEIVMAAAGPDFKRGFVDHAPSSNADIGMTLAHLLRLDIPAKGKLIGRVLGESLKGGKPITAKSAIVTSAPAANGLATTLRLQVVEGGTRYFDVAGFPGRTVGLDPAAPPVAHNMLARPSGQQTRY